MKILYIGGQKSGKSSLAEKKILDISAQKPYYIATYDNSTYIDNEMLTRIKNHKKRREEHFITIEESIHLNNVIKSGENYIVECLSMWILNSLEKDIDYKQIIDKILKIDANIVFVLNDVSSGIIPMNKLSREYIDASGIIGQIIASKCDEVYQVTVGLENRLK